MICFPLQRFHIQPNTPFPSKNLQQALWEKWSSFLFNLSWGRAIIHSFTAFNKAEPSGTLGQTPKDILNLLQQNQIPSCLSLSSEFYLPHGHSFKNKYQVQKSVVTKVSLTLRYICRKRKSREWWKGTQLSPIHRQVFLEATGLPWRTRT